MKYIVKYLPEVLLTLFELACIAAFMLFIAVTAVAVM